MNVGPSQKRILREAFREEEKESGSRKKEKQKLTKIRNQGVTDFLYPRAKIVEFWIRRIETPPSPKHLLLGYYSKTASSCQGFFALS